MYGVQATLEQTQTGWVEPMKEWIKEAETTAKIAGDHDLKQKKVMAKKLFGSNLQLTGRKIEIKTNESNGCEGETAWLVLRAGVENIEKIPNCRIVVARRGIEPLFLD